jgi:hypothetical protein
MTGFSALSTAHKNVATHEWFVNKNNSSVYAACIKMIRLILPRINLLDGFLYESGSQWVSKCCLLSYLRQLSCTSSYRVFIKTGLKTTINDPIINKNSRVWNHMGLCCHSLRTITIL